MPEETSDEKYKRSMIETDMQHYHSGRHTNRMKYCSDEYDWENNVSDCNIFIRLFFKGFW